MDGRPGAQDSAQDAHYKKEKSHGEWKCPADRIAFRCGEKKPDDQCRSERTECKTYTESHDLADPLSASAESGRDIWLQPGREEVATTRYRKRNRDFQHSLQG